MGVTPEWSERAGRPGHPSRTRGKILYRGRLSESTADAVGGAGRRARTRIHFGVSTLTLWLGARRFNRCLMDPNLDED